MCDMLQIIRDSGHIITGVDTVSCSAREGEAEKKTKLVEIAANVGDKTCSEGILQARVKGRAAIAVIVKTDGSFAALVKGDPTRWLLRPAAGGSDHK